MRVEGPDRFLNRELSWLDFNARVLALAEDADRPLLERVKFLAIFSQNLDEFFQVRVSGLQEQLAAGVRTRSPDGRDPLAQLVELGARVEELVARQDAVFTKDIAPGLEEQGIRFVVWDELDETDRAFLSEEFDERIFPILTPLAVDPAHPFPYISNLSLNLAVVVQDAESGTERFAAVKVPPLLPRFVTLPDGVRFLAVEKLIAAKLDTLFPGMHVIAHHPFRVTRDADFDLTEEAADLLEAVEDVLRQRSSSRHVVRLEVDSGMSDTVLALLCRELELGERDVTVVDGPLDLAGLWTIYDVPRPDLKEESWTPQTAPALIPTERGPDIFALLRGGDILVHHPYDSFATSVEALLEQAAHDPDVLAIKQTIYRTAGRESAIVRSLAVAAQAGKQVVALVELQARFDEEANIERARYLEDAGVHVVYGLVGLKTHAKILLVVRRERDGIRRYCHVGTGNYNPQTATIYEDLGLLTTDPAFGDDLTELFNHLTGYSHAEEARALLVAPDDLRNALVELVGGQAARGAGGRITLKMNSLVDPELIDALYAASAAGCPVELMVRGICCLRPGVPGLSAHIRVRSVVGRFLEHSRIYRFGGGPASECYIGSADLMPRNLDRRVEVLAPVRDPLLRARIDEILDIGLDPEAYGWTLDADGVWGRTPTSGGYDGQARLCALAARRAQRVHAAEDAE